MLSAVLVVSGAVLLALGCVRGYAAARGALLPLVREGDPTRAMVEAGRPVHARTRIRVALRHTALAMLWLGVAMYGMYLATVGFGVRG